MPISQVFKIFVVAEFLLAVGEGLYFSFFKSRDYDWKLFFTSVGHILGKRLLILLPVFFLGEAVFSWIYSKRLLTLALDSPLNYLLLFLLLEFFFYWQHRIRHRVRVFWATHSVHHASQRLNFATGSITGWIDLLPELAHKAFFLPLFFVGFSPEVIWAGWLTNVFFQLWYHNEWIPRLGWLEYILNTPAHHRLHHAKNPGYESGNFGALLIIFDRLFGTLLKEKEGVTLEYGIPGRPHSYNPVAISLYEWREMGRDLIRARSPREVFGVFFAAPAVGKS